MNLSHKKAIGELIQQALMLGRQNPILLSHPEVRKTLRHDLIDNLITLLFTAKQVEPVYSATRINYQKVVAKIREYILSHPQDVITVATICEQMHISRRTLQNCFQAVYGISPYVYLKAIRLNAVRRELMSAYSAYQTIQDAAMAWGFWHMGQFANDYHKLFGELPSHSLASRGGLRAY